MTNYRAILGFSAYVLFFAWLDWITYRSIVFILVVGGGLILAAAYRSRIAGAITSKARSGSAEWMSPVIDGWSRLPARVQRLLISLTPLLYFLLRGQGTSGAGTAAIIAATLVATASIFFGHLIDPPLQDLYAARDRLLGRWLRVLLAPVLGVLIAFLIVHGSLLDLPALFGGTTNSPQSPADMSGRFFLATLLAGACTVLLLREGRERA
ncbi:MAG: hypothetical protein ACT4NY_12680 [Pseudonocardiales bacterium]